MPFWARRSEDERLFWSRDDRFARAVARAAPGARVLDLESGWCVIGPAAELTDALVAGLADGRHHGLVAVDPVDPPPDRYLHALSAAVQASGIADRIGMDQSPVVAAAKLLDYFFTLRSRHHVVFQPLVDLRTRQTEEWEVLFRPEMPMLPQSIGGIVDAAIAAGRSVDLDLFILERILARVAELLAADPRRPMRLAINLTPASLLDARFEPRALAAGVRAAGLAPRQVTLECTEQQAVGDIAPLKRAVRALRRLGFGVAVDDAGAGYASFMLIAALRPQHDQDRSRDRARLRPRRRQASPHRGVRGLRTADRRPARGRGHREARGSRGPRRRRRRPGPGLPSRPWHPRARGASPAAGRGRPSRGPCGETPVGGRCAAPAPGVRWPASSGPDGGDPRER